MKDEGLNASGQPSSLIHHFSSLIFHLKLRVRGSHPALQAYEARTSTGPPAKSVTKGRVELPCLNRHDVLSVACLPFHHLVVLFQ
jgi:hypothetical protein